MTLWDLTKAALFILLLAIVVVWFDDESWEPVGSSLEVVDGDSLKLGDQRLRLIGIDAPELNQSCIQDGKSFPCGQRAKEHLRMLVSGRKISCADHGLDKHGRTLSVCRFDEDSERKNANLVFTGKQNSINAQMVHDGWAVAYGDYKALELLAVVAKRGLWAVEFERPETWRKTHGSE